MPLDAICLTAVKNELAGQIIGMKIDKVQQPERDVIILSLRGSGVRALRLLISVGSGDARVHLTEHSFDNPIAPPMFCMLLRKHLTGARIIEISQPPAERVLMLRLETSSAMGVQSEKCLIVEMIGRQTNIILRDSDGVIIDCLRRIGGDLDEKRSVLPGLKYRDPTPQEGKLNPLKMTKSVLQELFKNAGHTTIDKWINTTFTSFSPLLCREIVWRAYGDVDIRTDAVKDDGTALFTSFLSLIDQINSADFEPWMLLSDKRAPKEFSYTHIMQYEKAYEANREDSFSIMLDSFFTRSAQANRMSQRSAETLKLMKTARERVIRKIAAQRAELEDTSKGDSYRQCGDLITANFHLIKKGQKCLLAEDFYSESNALREIELDPTKTPQQNSAKYYKAYTKAKNARKFLDEQIQSGENEFLYVESVIEQLERIENEQDLNEIREELIQTGYIKKYQQQKKKQKESLPHRFLSSSGFQILVGRNNVQNDKLTLKTASRSDVWLHAQKIHGAHVIISNAGSVPDDQTLHEAAAIAAYYSSARSGTKVPIDYTQVKNVKKPPGGRPGMVIYNDFKTITAEPDEQLVNKLRENK